MVPPCAAPPTLPVVIMAFFTAATMQKKTTLGANPGKQPAGEALA